MTFCLRGTSGLTREITRRSATEQPTPMTKLLRLLAVGLLACGVTRAAPAPLELAGVTYTFAFAQVGKDGAVTNEYVPAGQDLKAWTTLVGVRHWPRQTSLRQVVGDWLKMVEPLLTRKVEVFPAGDPANANDQIVEAWISAPDKSYIEINLHRFVRVDGVNGIRAFQYAHRIPMPGGKGDPAPFLEQRKAVMAGLARLALIPGKPPEVLREELQAAEAAVVEMRAKYNEGYPALRAKLRDIAALKQQLGIADATPAAAGK